MKPTRARSVADMARLWLPTAASTTMLTLEIPLLLALAARVGDHVIAVAGLGLALGIIVPVNAGALALGTTSAVAIERGWRRQTMRRYALLVGGAGCLLLAVFWSGCVDRPVESVLNVNPDTWDATRHALFGLAFAPLLVAVRRYNQGYLIAAGETRWFLPATLARMSTSVLLAALFTWVFAAGTGGIGLALMLGVALEAGLLSYRNRGARAADTRERTRVGLWEIARVHAPLTGAMLLTVMPPTAVLLLLGATGGSAEMLAAWPVLYGLAWLIAGMTIDLEAITASHHRTSTRAARTFALALGGTLSVLWCTLEFGSAATMYFSGFSGLDASTAALATTGITALVPFALLCAVREWLRGVLVAERQPRHTLAGVAIGFAAMLAVLLIGSATGMHPIRTAAASVSAGAAAEVVALMAFCPGLIRLLARQLSLYRLVAALRSSVVDALQKRRLARDAGAPLAFDPTFVHSSSSERDSR